MEKLLEKFPVYIVQHKNIGLLGAQVMSRRLLRNQGEHLVMQQRL